MVRGTRVWVRILVVWRTVRSTPNFGTHSSQMCKYGTRYASLSTHSSQMWKYGTRYASLSTHFSCLTYGTRYVGTYGGTSFILSRDNRSIWKVKCKVRGWDRKMPNSQNRREKGDSLVAPETLNGSGKGQRSISPSNRWCLLSLVYIKSWINSTAVK